MSQIEKLVSVKGKPMILYEGYIYTVERTSTTKLIMRCQNRDCKARCHTNLSMDAFISPPTSHSHAPQPDRVPVVQLKNEIKARATTTDESTSTILHSALRTFPLSAAGELPRNESLMLMIRRQRTVGKVDADGRLPEKLRKTYRDEDFILHEDENLIIFTTKTNLSILKRHKHWFADGTFKVSDQLSVSFFSHFFDADKVTNGYELIAEQFDDEADDLLDYFERTWIGERKRRGAGRKKPKFDHTLWNIYDRVVAGVPRSNNSVEGWHNAFANRVAINHPDIVKLAEKIRREQSKFEVDMAKILQGHDIKTKKVCYRQLDERITRL
ncbi:unnamed protein product, partial [Rotaria sp. Silwood2]